MLSPRALVQCVNVMKKTQTLSLFFAARALRWCVSVWAGWSENNVGGGRLLHPPTAV